MLLLLVYIELSMYLYLIISVTDLNYSFSQINDGLFSLFTSASLCTHNFNIENQS